MPQEPQHKRVVSFVDGQNLFYAAKEAFGYSYPNYDVNALSHSLCGARGWDLIQVRFYTGIPDASDDPEKNHFWSGKLAVMGKQAVEVFSRPLRYRNKKVRLPDNTTHTFLAGEEKGIDVRIALDVMRLARLRQYDAALIFSQDQDLSEVAEEIRVLASEQNRWIKIVSAFPSSPASRNRRGINKTDWIRIDRATYDACIDRRDYRQKSKTS
ncbi:MAG: NYN domain-containing protein [Candidatus Acidiferrales bacterium]